MSGDRRCEYCGRTAYELSLLFDDEEVLCRCHGHCTECRKLVKAHKERAPTETHDMWSEIQRKYKV